MVEIFKYNETVEDRAQKEKVIEIAKSIIKSMDTHAPIPFDVGLNALIMAMSGALSTIDKSYEQKIKIAKHISDAVILNMYPNGAPN